VITIDDGLCDEGDEENKTKTKPKPKPGKVTVDKIEKPDKEKAVTARRANE
jgi:hypothetical protein